MSALDGFSRSSFTHEGVTRDVYRAGSGPAVIVIHEMPGLTPKVAEFGASVAGAGFTAVLPSLFGEPDRPPTTRYLMRELVRGCVAREFTSWARQRTSPITVWCRALAKSLHGELGGNGVGAIGMCFTGGFALAMMVDDHTVAPVVSQPSVPFAIGRRRAASIDLSPADRERVRARAVAGCEVLGLRYKGDKAVPAARFQALHELLGDRFIAVEFEGNGHSVLTEHVQEEGVARVLAFIQERLR
jgi:dienelactone hydrolase